MPDSRSPDSSSPGSYSVVSQCLAEQVAGSLDDYFTTLNGHEPPKDLYGMVIGEVEPPLLRAVLRYCQGNQSRAAEVLGLNRATLRKKLRQHGIAADAS